MAVREYQAALEAVTAIYGEHDLAAGAEWQHKVRSAVQMNRFFADNPELEKDLNGSMGVTKFLSAGLENTLVERGTIAATGFGLRVAAVGAFGTFGLFAAAPFVGFSVRAVQSSRSLKKTYLRAWVSVTRAMMWWGTRMEQMKKM